MPTLTLPKSAKKPVSPIFSIKADEPKPKRLVEVRGGNGERPLSIDEARRRFVKRFTLNHIPHWAKHKLPNGKYPGPRYESDQHWYATSEFIGFGATGVRKYIREGKPTYPVGRFLDAPFTKAVPYTGKKPKGKDPIRKQYPKTVKKGNDKKKAKPKKG